MIIVTRCSSGSRVNSQHEVSVVEPFCVKFAHLPESVWLCLLRVPAARCSVAAGTGLQDTG